MANTKTLNDVVSETNGGTMDEEINLEEAFSTGNESSMVTLRV